MVRYAISLKTCRNVITKPTGGGEKRPGYLFRGGAKHNDRATRFIPFIYSTTVKYAIELGDGYMRFWVGGALLRNGAGDIVEVATPHRRGHLQGAAHAVGGCAVPGAPVDPAKELRRLAVDQFELRDFEYRRGPFRPFNNDEAALLAVSGTQGVVTVTTNVPTFTAEMVGSLLYAEERSCAR